MSVSLRSKEPRATRPSPCSAPCARRTSGTPMQHSSIPACLPPEAPGSGRSLTSGEQTRRGSGEQHGHAVAVALPILVLAASLAPSCGAGSSGGGTVRFRTAKVERGEVVEGVMASGTVQPLELVQVGTQVSGVIQRLEVDFNSKVHAGQTI